MALARHVPGRLEQVGQLVADDDVGRATIGSMARRPDPERIRQAWEAGMRARIRDAHEDPDKVLATWDEIASARGLDPASRAYWDALEEWWAQPDR